MTTSREELENAIKKSLKLNVSALTPDMKTPRVSSGSLAIDRALGGGWGIGKINNIAGPESYGKTTICLQTVTWFLEHDERGVAYFDVENSLDPTWARRNGLDLARVAIFQGYDDDENRLGQEVILAMVDSVIRSRQAGLIIVDSLAVMKPQETGGSKKGDMVEYGRAIMGQRAKNFDDFFAVVAPVLQVTKQTLLVVNQLRSSMNPMGDPFVEPGGDAKNYAYSLSVRLTKPDIVEVEDKQTHHVFNGYIKKNKVGGRRGAKFSAYFGLHPTGRVYPDLIPELCAIGKDMGVFTNAQGEKFSNGTWHYKGKALQIKDDVVKSLADAQRLLAANEDLRKEIELEIRKEIDRENFNDF